MTVFGFGSNFINFDGLNSSNAITRRNSENTFLAPTRTYRPRQIRLGIEPHQIYSRTPDGLDRLLSLVDSPAIGVNFRW